MSYRVFVSGSISIEKLDKEVVERLENIINSGYQILVGDANGVDASIQKYLDFHHAKNVIVYCVGDMPRNNIGNWKVRHIESSERTGTKNYFTAKDMSMAEECNYGFMIWDTRSTGTLKNVLELLKLGKYSLIYINSTKKFLKVKSVMDFEELLVSMGDRSRKKAEEKLKLPGLLSGLKNTQDTLF